MSKSTTTAEAKFTDVKEWEQRFAIIHSLDLNDKDVMKNFQVTSAELKKAKKMITDETIEIDVDFDVEPFKALLNPVSATKKTKAPAAKSTKIKDAMENIPKTVEEAVLLSDFIVDFPVSLHCLRQQKRFDNTGLGGKIRVRKIDDNDEPSIWRDMTPQIAKVAKTEKAAK